MGSKSARPYKRTPPSWCKVTTLDVNDQICKLAKKGLTPSQIGVILRDSNGIAQVRSVTGQKIVRILKVHGLAPEIPEDLYMLIKKAVQVRKHLERNRQDKDSKFRLKAVFIVFRDITGPPESSLQIGSTSLPLRPPWLLNSYHNVIMLLVMNTYCNANCTIVLALRTAVPIRYVMREKRITIFQNKG